MRSFRLYLLVGGMPKAVSEYIDTNDLLRVDKIKREIINLYLADLKKIDKTGRLSRMFEDTLGRLNRHFILNDYGYSLRNRP